MMTMSTMRKKIEHPPSHIFIFIFLGIRGLVMMVMVMVIVIVIVMVMVMVLVMVMVMVKSDRQCCLNLAIGDWMNSGQSHLSWPGCQFCMMSV